MTPRENLLALLRRQPYEYVSCAFLLCPDLEKTYHETTGSDLSYFEYFDMPWAYIDDIIVPKNDSQYLKYHPNLKEGSTIDRWGVGHEPGSEAAKHMTYMRCPLRGKEQLSEVEAYPLPDFAHGDASHQKAQAEAIHKKGLAAVGDMQCTIWETSWYMRGMEDLMMDMMCDDPIATYLLDAVTERAIVRAQSFTRAGADILYFGDDIGMQRTPMMSLDLYCKWLKPRLKQVVDAAKSINPDVLIAYHSCGHITPFIPHLIEVGIDILNPIQPESMDFKEIYKEFGGKISFHGTIGTQTTMPFGTPQQIREKVFEHMEIAKDKGGLFPAPTHLLEPEVLWENILAYVQACKDYCPNK